MKKPYLFSIVSVSLAFAVSLLAFTARPSVSVRRIVNNSPHTFSQIQTSAVGQHTWSLNLLETATTLSPGHSVEVLTDLGTVDIRLVDETGRARVVTHVAFSEPDNTWSIRD